MDHSPIYRSDQLRIPSAWLPWRRTASLVTATAALAFSGIVLGYQGVPDLPLDGAARQPSGGGVVDGGHPDALGLLSQVLAARFPHALPVSVLSVAAARVPPVGPVQDAASSNTPELITPDTPIPEPALVAPLAFQPPVAPVFGPPVLSIASRPESAPLRVPAQPAVSVVSLSAPPVEQPAPPPAQAAAAADPAPAQTAAQPTTVTTAKPGRTPAPAKPASQPETTKPASQPETAKPAAVEPAKPAVVVESARPDPVPAQPAPATRPQVAPVVHQPAPEPSPARAAADPAPSHSSPPPHADKPAAQPAPAPPPASAHGNDNGKDGSGKDAGNGKNGGKGHG